MPISKSERWIFVHVPKTAGTSVEAALGVQGDWRVEDRERMYGRIASPDVVAHGYRSKFLQHLTLPEIHEVVPQSQGWFSFAFVRNPWDRMVSVHSRPDPQMVWSARDRGIELEGLEFEEFLRRTADIDHAHLAPQADYLESEEGECLVDFVGRFEHLQRDFDEVCRRIGSSAKLPHENRSPGRPRGSDYRAHYTDRTREVVAERYRRDIEAFDYSF